MEMMQLDSCQCCDESIIEKLIIHHYLYVKNDVVYNNYNTKGSIENRIKYYKDLEKMVKQMPFRFTVLCNKCHETVEELNKINDEKRTEFVKSKYPDATSWTITKFLHHAKLITYQS